jgi:hypothetical protein
VERNPISIIRIGRIEIDRNGNFLGRDGKKIAAQAVKGPKNPLHLEGAWWDIIQ